MTRGLLGTLVLVLAMVAGPDAAPATRIVVTPVVSDGRVLASFTAPAAFDAEIREVIGTGLLVTFSFDVALRRPSAVWFDRTVASVVVAASIKFDNLTGTYHVSKLQDGRVVWSDTTRDAGVVKSWVTTFERVAFEPDAALEPNAEYYVRVTLQTTPRRTLPLWPWQGGGATGRAEFTFVR